MRKHQTVRKKEGHQVRKNFNKKKEREVNARIFIKFWENNNSWKDMKDMRFHERSFKLRGMSKKTRQEKKINKSDWFDHKIEC